MFLITIIRFFYPIMLQDNICGGLASFRLKGIINNYVKIIKKNWFFRNVSVIIHSINIKPEIKLTVIYYLILMYNTY